MSVAGIVVNQQASKHMLQWSSSAARLTIGGKGAVGIGDLDGVDKLLRLPHFDEASGAAVLGSMLPEMGVEVVCILGRLRSSHGDAKLEGRVQRYGVEWDVGEGSSGRQEWEDEGARVLAEGGVILVGEGDVDEVLMEEGGGLKDGQLGEALVCVLCLGQSGDRGGAAHGGGVRWWRGGRGGSRGALRSAVGREGDALSRSGSDVGWSGVEIGHGSSCELAASSCVVLLSRSPFLSLSGRTQAS